ncbi:MULTISPECIES: hypothetical protein [Streptomyces]|uniref:Uncharacterized protein n=1 Tax=Streptomyces rhizosphaericola TaxID=2564098 RepID=A0ABY2P8Y2_9ACTN|nr:MULTISPECIES: hypothetical protein [Streptomyces]ARI56200.1 hypothetical protein A6E92_31530 [Streptomyces sp. S8]MYT37977.1 hypothetical protein [Streptomyces sp. SID8356]MYT93108.1 hypothetical protein [Streptomyces sp. SID8359]MYT99331.1 hypothetical protein [Streptomyces sp. SID8350]NGO84211.1 hypothetical protein [Streptomyces sp. 196(2019)]
MIRRIAITLAAVAAAGFVAAAPASASGWDGHAGGGHAGIEGGWAIGEYQNLGGPYGITTIKGQAAYFDAERGWMVR